MNPPGERIRFPIGWEAGVLHHVLALYDAFTPLPLLWTVVGQEGARTNPPKVLTDRVPSALWCQPSVSDSGVASSERVYFSGFR